MKTLIALIGSLAAAGMLAAQSPTPRLVITSPTADDVLTGIVMLSAEVREVSAGITGMSFFVDGMPACTVNTAPFQCTWDVSSTRGVRDVRAVAQLGDGMRLTSTVRTRGTVASFRASADSVRVALRVQDRHGRFVRGLTADSLRLLEDGVPQRIVTFATESEGGEVVVALDGSGSMAQAVGELRAAARTFLGALPRNDKVMVTAFNSAIDVLAPWQSDPVTRVAALDRLKATGMTALYDVMIQAVDLFPAGGERRAIVMFTDGDDVASRASAAAARQALQGANVVLYIIAQGKAVTDSRLKAQLSTLAVETGGAAFIARRMSDTRGHFAEIAEELSNQYVVGYVPSRPLGDGAWRQIRVEASDPDTRYDIKARQGYLAVTRASR